MRSVLRGLRSRGAALRFRVWALRLDARLRRNGSRLILDCPSGGRFVTPPIVELPLLGGGAGSLTLRLAPGASLGRGLILEVWAGGQSVLDLGHDTWLGAGCRVQLQGGRVRIGDRAQVRDGCLLKARGELTVGDRTIVSRGAIVHADERVSIGAFVGVGERVSVIDSDHAHDGSDTPFWEQELRTGPIEIERNVSIGANCVILRGTTIGCNSVVGAGAVLTGDEYPAGWLIAGVPARPLHPLAAGPAGASGRAAAAGEGL